MDEYLAKYQETNDPDMKFDYLVAMCLVREEKALKKVLKLLGDVKVVKPQDQLHLFIYLYRNPKARKASFEWLSENWGWVKKTLGDKSLDSYPRYTANIIRTGAEFKDWQEFFEPMRDDPVLSRAIEIGEREITARLKLIKKDREAVYEKLNGATLQCR